VCSVLDRAVVLGSTQRLDVVDAGRAAGAGVAVAHRDSGGGAVLVAPDAQVWLDLWLPRGDVLWDDDVIRSSRWLGEAWRRVLLELGVPGAHVHDGRAVHNEWSRLVCFAGTGPGEVITGVCKIVGLSQRRTRHGARFSSMAPLSWDPAALLGVLALDADVVRRGRAELASLATGLRGTAPAVASRRDGDAVDMVYEVFLRHLD
jgi:lipoate-protein ligase A